MGHRKDYQMELGNLSLQPWDSQREHGETVTAAVGDPEGAPDGTPEPVASAVGELEGLPDGALEWETQQEAVGVSWQG
jgi:hypothetical protein